MPPFLAHFVSHPYIYATEREREREREKTTVPIFSSKPHRQPQRHKRDPLDHDQLAPRLLLHRPEERHRRQPGDERVSVYGSVVLQGADQVVAVDQDEGEGWNDAGGVLVGFGWFWF